MKKYLLSTLLLALTIIMRAQYVTIPDPNLIAWLQQLGYGPCFTGNQLDTTCNFLTQPVILNCSNRGIANLEGIQYFDNLRDLYSNGNPITNIPPLQATVQKLYLNNCNLTQLPVLPQQLQVLSCYNNQLSTLPTLPTSIKWLDVSHNPLQQLPALSTALLELTCNNIQLSTMPALPQSLTKLECANNQLTVLPTLPANLATLICNDNSLSTLPTLPSTLATLTCDSNQITNLPSFPASLLTVSCSYNQLTALPALPVLLRYLYCNNNLLTALPAFPSPSSLLYLNCEYNKITTIPQLPPQLYWLKCGGDTFLTYMPPILRNMLLLEFHNTRITSLPAFPDTIYNLNISNNPVLACLPKLNAISNFNFSGCDIQCLPNYGHVSTSTPTINTLPICNVFNSNGCPVLYNISGRVYIDSNADCVLDPNETGADNIKVMLLNNGVLQQQALTGYNGYYSFEVSNAGVYSVLIDTASLSFEVACPTNNLYQDTITLTDTLAYNNNFGLRCKPNFDIAAWGAVALSNIRPGNDVNIKLAAGDISSNYGAHCAAGVSGSVKIIFNGPATYVSTALATPNPNNITGNTLTWNIADYGAVNALQNFNIVIHIDSAAQAGQQVCFTIVALPYAGDADTTNNALTHCFTIVNSYDPNDKAAYPAGNIDTAQEWLTYTVRFQNTGTAEAQHIYIMDTLDTDVDAATFQLLAYSHQPNVQIKENIARFNFPNINLPDSISDEPGSHGYIQYKVKLKEGLPIGTTIENTAFIYFDFNAPVATNTTSNTVVLVVDTNEVGIVPIANDIILSVYPNPANSTLTIATNQTGNTIAIYNAQGGIVIKQNMTKSAEKLNIAELANGVYYVEVSNTQGTARKKFIKL